MQVRGSPDLRGLVLSLYGTGNGPSHKETFLQTIRDATRRGRDTRVGALCADVRRSDESARQAAGRVRSAPCSRLLMPGGERVKTGQVMSPAHVRCFCPSCSRHCVGTWASGPKPSVCFGPASPARTRQNFFDLDLPLRKQATQYGSISVAN